MIFSFIVSVAYFCVLNFYFIESYRPLPIKYVRHKLQKTSIHNSNLLNDIFIDINNRNNIDSKHIWWDLFGETSTSNVSTTNSDKFVNPSWLPSISAWQNLEALNSENSNNLPSINAWRSFSNIENVEKKSENISPPSSLSDYLNGSYQLSEDHLLKIQELWKLVKNRGSMKHLINSDVYRVIEALKVAYIALWGKKTLRSLEVAINRAQGIAAVLGEFRADVTVVLAGILAEVVSEMKSSANEDVGVIKQLSEKFGEDVVKLADQYTRLPKFMARKTQYTPVQSENQVQMLVTMAEDYRVLYIRIADRLHSLRVIKKLPLDDTDKIKIAQEALCVYAPLAHKMGMIKDKGELEDLAFRILEPEMFVKTRVTQMTAMKAYYDAVEIIKETLEDDPVLRDQNTRFKMTFRIKDKYQIFLKMHRKGLKSLSDVRDVLGLRLIVNTPKLPNESEEDYVKRGETICYYIVERLRSMPGWDPVEKGYKDYILNKKENGYQSLHQYIRNCALNTNVEVQVRTRQMHLNAELGEAAHWFYKDQIYRKDVSNSRVYRMAWRQPKQMQAKSPAELIGMAKAQLLSSRVFVYLEDKSTVLNLKKGSTVLDAAFSIHTDVGLTTSAIRINGELVQLNHELKHNDVISVTCTNNSQVTATPLWFDNLHFSYSQAVLRKYFRENQYHRELVIAHGLAHFLLTVSLTFHDQDISKKFPDPSKLIKLAKDRTGQTIHELLFVIGSSSKADAASIIARWLSIPQEKIKITSLSVAYLWGKMQGQTGWEDKWMKNNVLLPLLNETLPLFGHQNVLKYWLEVFGSNSLDDSQYEEENLLALLEFNEPESIENISIQSNEEKIINSVNSSKFSSIHNINNYQEEDLKSSWKTSPSYLIASSPVQQNFRSFRSEKSLKYAYSLSPYKIIPFKHSKSPFELASKPFSLEAAALSPSLQRLAKKTYAEQALARKKCSNYQ
eukprot:gene4058-5801_t